MRRATTLLLRSLSCRERQASEASCSFTSSVSWSSLQRNEEAALEPEYEMETIHAQTRSRAGRLAVKKYRKEGRVPAILFSLPGEIDQLITLEKPEADRLVANYGRSGLTSRLFSLQVTDKEQGDSKTYPVLPKMVHRTAASGMVENITLMHCPPERIVRVQVPIKVMGEDVSPGVKKGGFVNMVRRKVNCLCSGSAVPPHLEVDVSSLQLGDKVGLEALELPPGVLLNEKHAVDPVCKIAGKAARE